MCSEPGPGGKLLKCLWKRNHWRAAIIKFNVKTLLTRAINWSLSKSKERVQVILGCFFKSLRHSPAVSFLFSPWDSQGPHFPEVLKLPPQVLLPWHLLRTLSPVPLSDEIITITLKLSWKLDQDVSKEILPFTSRYPLYNGSQQVPEFDEVSGPLSGKRQKSCAPGDEPGVGRWPSSWTWDRWSPSAWLGWIAALG